MNCFTRACLSPRCRLSVRIIVFLLVLTAGSQFAADNDIQATVYTCVNRHPTLGRSITHDYKGDIRRYRIDKGVADQGVTIYAGGDASHVQLSADGLRIAFIDASDRLCIMPSSGGDILVRWAIPRELIGAQPPQWSWTSGENCRWLYFTPDYRDSQVRSPTSARSSDCLWRIDVNTGRIEPFRRFNQPIERFWIPVFANECNGAAIFDQPYDTGRIYRLETDDGDLSHAPRIGVSCGMDMSPDGSLLICNRGSHQEALIIRTADNAEEARFSLAAWWTDARIAAPDGITTTWQSFRWARNSTRLIAVTHERAPTGDGSGSQEVCDAVLYDWVGHRQIWVTNNLPLKPAELRQEIAVGAWDDDSQKSWMDPAPLGRWRLEAPARCIIPQPASGHWTLEGRGTDPARPWTVHLDGPGRETIAARRQEDGATLTGIIDVVAPTAPSITCLERSSPTVLLASFSKRLLARRPRIGLLSRPDSDIRDEDVIMEAMARVRCWTLVDNGHGVAIELFSPPQDGSQLFIDGYTDLSPNRLELAELRDIPKANWQAPGDRLIFAQRDHRRPQRIFDPADGVLLNPAWTLQGPARVDEKGRLQLRGGTAFLSYDATRFILRSVGETGECTIELVLRSAHPLPEGPTTKSAFFQLSKDLLLGQVGDHLAAWIRGNDGTLRRIVSTGGMTLDPLRYQHVALTYLKVGSFPGELRISLDGVECLQVNDGDLRLDPPRPTTHPGSGVGTQIDEGSAGLHRRILLGGCFQTAFSEYRLMNKGDAPGRTLPWNGTIERLAVHARRLDLPEIRQRRDMALADASPSPPPPETLVVATLKACSATPEAKAIVPYHDALVLADWQIERVLSGTCPDTGIRVAHWGLLRDHPMLADAEWTVGSRQVLRLAPIESLPDMERYYQADTLPPSQKQLWYDLR